MMRRLSAKHSALLIVDMQASLMPVIDQAQARVDTVERLAQSAKLMGIPVLATEHLVDKLGPTVSPLADHLEAVCHKSHFDGSREEGFEAFIGSERNQILVVGAEAHVCVMQTALGLLQSGREVWVVADACGSRHEADRVLALNRLSRAGAEIVSAEMVMFEWLETAHNPRFRDVLKAIKSRDQ